MSIPRLSPSPFYSVLCFFPLPVQILGQEESLCVSTGHREPDIKGEPRLHSQFETDEQTDRQKGVQTDRQTDGQDAVTAIHICI